MFFFVLVFPSQSHLIMRDPSYETEDIKCDRVGDFQDTFKKYFPKATLNLTYKAPNSTDTIIEPHLWAEGITVYQREGKLYVYFRDLYEFELCSAYMEMKIALFVEFYLDYYKLKYD